MIRILVLLLCLGLAGHAHAQGGFDADALAKLQAEAIDFMVPRTMEPVSPGQLALWGLGGLTGIDPGLTVVARDRKAALLARGRVVFETPMPGADPVAWGQVAAGLTAAAWQISPAMRRLGQAAIAKILFDEMLAHLDPYSRYIPPIEAMSDRDRRAGHAGIGIGLGRAGSNTVAREVVMGSPAAKAGVYPGATILWIDGRGALGRDPATVEAMLNGPEGTEVEIGWRTREGTSRVAIVTRAMVPPETVYPRRSGDVLILQITGFSQTTDQHVAQAVFDNSRAFRPLKGIVLDLRGNRGGLLRVAVATADIFLTAGVVVRSAGRAAEANRIWVSDKDEMAKGLPMAVLIDGGTASAAEVLAAALTDRGRAIAIGSSTFGKGVVQTIDPLPDGGELFLTWSRLLAPKGWPIQSLGVMPQVCTSLGEESLRRQLGALAAGQWVLRDAVSAHRAARAPMTPDQIVSIRERCPGADPRESDLAVAQALVENPVSHSAALFERMAEE